MEYLPNINIQIEKDLSDFNNLDKDHLSYCKKKPNVIIENFYIGTLPREQKILKETLRSMLFGTNVIKATFK